MNQNAMNLRSMLLLLASLSACGQLPGADAGTDAGPAGDGGFFLYFTPPGGAANNSLLFTVTGEGAATDGTAFPPATAGEPYFLDGWEVTYSHVLVTIGAASVHENPDLNPNDQSQTGALVAEVTGPWAIDLAKPGPLDAKEQNGKAWALARLTNQNRKAGSPAFDPTAKYAFSYSLVAAAERAQSVNLDAEAEAAYRTMAEKGWTVLLQGTATWKGAQGTPACRATDAAYDFGRFPKAVKFSLGFKMPVNFRNCVNPELSPADSRGVQTSTSAQTVVQATFHLDHPFWEALEEDAPLRWDAIAARKSVATGSGPASVDVTIDDLAFDFQAPRDAQGAAIPWRTCGPTQPNERSTGAVAYDPVNVPVNPAGGAAGLKDLVDYMTYNLSSFGHLNNDGLCFPDRQYPSPR